jgi:hypothetical protein
MLLLLQLIFRLRLTLLTLLVMAVKVVVPHDDAQRHRQYEVQKDAYEIYFSLRMNVVNAAHFSRHGQNRETAETPCFQRAFCLQVYPLPPESDSVRDSQNFSSSKSYALQKICYSITRITSRRHYL